MGYRAYIPTSLVGKVDDRTAYLLSCIRWQQAIGKTKENGYSPLKLTYLRQVLGRRAAGKAIAGAEAAGLIQRDHGWMTGVASMGYRVARPYSQEPVAGVEYRDSDITDRLKSWQEWRIAEAIGNHAGRQWVYDNLPYIGFRGGINAVFAAHAGDVDKLNLMIQSVGRIEDRDWWFTADPKSGRIYHNVVTLPRVCRSLLLVDGQPAAETDIANCQPLLLGATLYDRGCTERARFLELCIAGRFYEHMAIIMGAEYASREHLKVAVYQNIMYGGKWHTTQPPFMAFARAWPVLAAKIAATKEGKGAKSMLPVVMQKAEADLMVGRVVPRLAVELPGCRAVTIHDSLVTGERYASDATAIIEDEMRRAYGCSPPVRKKLAA